MAKVWVESEYYLNLESEDKIITPRLSHRCKFQFEFCVNLLECCVNFDCKTFEMETKHCKDKTQPSKYQN